MIDCTVRSLKRFFLGTTTPQGVIYQIFRLNNIIIVDFHERIVVCTYGEGTPTVLQLSLIYS